MSSATLNPSAIEFAPRSSKLTAAAADAQPFVPCAQFGHGRFWRESKKLDIRGWDFQRRAELSMGEHIPVFIGNTVILVLPLPLLQKTSANYLAIHQNGMIQLPADVEQNGVLRLADYLAYITSTNRKPIQMSTKLSTFDALSVCAAAKALGMDRYTSNIYKLCEAVLRNDIPSYDDLDAILFFATQHERLYKKVVGNLAIRCREHKIPDPGSFMIYLDVRPTLNYDIWVHNSYWAEKTKQRAERQEKHARHKEGQPRRQPQDGVRVEERSVWQKEKDERSAAWQKEKDDRDNAWRKEKEERDTMYWAEKNKKRAELEKACVEKAKGPMDKRTRLSAEERAHWLSTRGAQPPKGC
jgi:hypothetical protein